MTYENNLITGTHFDLNFLYISPGDSREYKYQALHLLKPKSLNDVLSVLKASATAARRRNEPQSVLEEGGGRREREAVYYPQ